MDTTCNHNVAQVHQPSIGQQYLQIVQEELQQKKYLIELPPYLLEV
jgi:hypothetical protein